MKNNKISFIIALATALIFLMPVGMQVNVNAETDWKGKEKWGGESHSDSKPTEKEFWNVAEDKRLHSLAKCIDWMECKENDIDFDKFRETRAWINATEDQKFCIVESEDLGNSLVDYEVLDCYKNPDYYEER